MKRNSLIPRTLKILPLIFIFSFLHPVMSLGQGQPLDNLNITVKLYNPRDNSAMDLTEREMKLTSQKVIWKEGDTPQKLLKVNHFYLDGELLGILYKLNPGLDAKSLKAGKEIILPVVKNKEEFSREFDKGYLVLLTLDDDLKQEFCNFSNELSAFTAETSGLNVQQFESPGERDNFVKATKSIVETMETFKVVRKERGRPLSSDMLKQMLNEAEQAKLILHNTIIGKQKLSMADAQTLNLIEKNMTRRKRILSEEKGKGQLPGLVKTPEKVSWNAWFEEDASKKEVENALVVGTRYVVNVDLSRYYYRERYAAIPDSRLSAKLLGGEKVKLLLQPIVVGELIRSVDREPFESKELTVNRSRMIPGPTEEEKAKAYKDGKISTREFANDVNLGSIVSWDIVAMSPGCATMAFSVWNDAFTEPLDHVLVTFPVINNDEKPPEHCGLGVAKKGMQAGLDTLLLIGPTGAGAEGKLADAALHVFEVSSGGAMRSLAVFVNHDELKEAHKNPSAKQKGVYAWELPSALSEYISKPSQLPELITNAHEYVRQGVTCPYKEVPADLDAEIFGANTGQNLTQAQLARESLNRLKKGTVVLTHLISADGGVIYLPLGLLGAKTQDTQDVSTARRFTFVQTLPQQRFTEKACIGSWTFAMPSRLGGVDTGNEVNLLHNNAPPANAWLKNHKELLQYFTTDAPKGAQGEGLILLSHHGDGYIWYDQSEVPARIRATMITRRFPAGSVAILAACSTSGSCEENRVLVKRLNQQGIDAIILSPFAVVPAFGIRLALEFQKHALAAFQNKSNVTFLELFQLASNDTIKDFVGETGYQDMALEFQVVGRASLRLCNK